MTSLVEICRRVPTVASNYKLSSDEVRAARADLKLSASEAARIVGLSEGAAWRRWERDGVTGPGAVLVRALCESRAVREYFGLSRLGMVPAEKPKEGQMPATYITTTPVNSALTARIESLIPAHCRSVKCLHGDTDVDPVCYEAHKSEIKYVRRAIRIAVRNAKTEALERANDAAIKAAPR